ncbi:MAG TPA: hypothetical protein VGO92_12435 [Acidimicrobiales bacterium]|jgi:hypothetical protein|nr:hypothetical protein [Acidimicrobiales bacterium]
MRRLDWFPWALRAAWAVLPVTMGGSLDVEPWAAAALWAGWAVVLLATLAPHPLGLTALRMAAPAAVALALWSTGPGAVASAVVACALAFAPAAGMLFVNGAAYPNERRFPLRAPGPLLAGLLPLAWVLAVGLPTAGARLAASGRVAFGAAVLAVGLPVAALLVRAMHGLSRRWLVFVPAGVVLHDPLSLADPVLFQRRVVEALRLAPADTDSLDLTQRSPGLAVELVLTEKVPMMLVRPGRRQGESGSSGRLLCTPTRPGAVLAEARSRRLA